MSRASKNGLDAANAEPVKSHSKHATDFIATDDNGQLSFLPPLPFCPTWPTKHTLEDEALALLLAGRLIDHPEFEGDCGSWRLAAVVFNLRALGWPIDTILTPAPTDRHPGRTVALYHLPSKYAALAHTDSASRPCADTCTDPTGNSASTCTTSASRGRYGLWLRLFFRRHTVLTTATKRATLAVLLALRNHPHHIQEIIMTAITLDIETIPSQQPGTLKKAESIAAWWKDDSEAAVDDAHRKQSLDGGTHGEIISIALVANDQDDDAGWVHCRTQDESEGALLTRFAEAVVERLDDAAAGLKDGYNFAQDPYFIAHNAAFDLPYIWHRCIINGVRLPFKFPRPSAREGKDYGCTMLAWAGYGGRVSLDALCRALSVPTPKDGGINGAGVYDAWLAGEYERIETYNLRDTLATCDVWQRLQGGTQ